MKIRRVKNYGVSGMDSFKKEVVKCKREVRYLFLGERILVLINNIFGDFGNSIW